MREPDAPVATVDRWAENRVVPVLREGVHAVQQELAGQLGGVHADEQRRSVHVLERRREPLLQTCAALRDHLEPFALPPAGVALEYQDLPGRGRALDDVERVKQRGLGDASRLAGRARWAQARLRTARERSLCDHYERNAFHASNVLGERAGFDYKKRKRGRKRAISRRACVTLALVPVPFVDPSRPPPGPFQPTFWRSPLRGPWLTSVLGFALLVAIPIVVLTGFLSNDAYYPRLGGNSVGRPLGPLDFYLFPFPTHPSWLYALTQGLHVTVGLAAFPILLAKLWSVIPKLFEWPPVRTPAHALERLSLALLLGGALFEFATGILNIQYAYLFQFFFTTAHYYGAWVFTAAFVFHAAVKLPTMRKALATRRALAPLRDSLVDTRPEPLAPVASDLIPVAPAPATMSRRALLGSVGLGSLLLLVQGAGQSIGGPFRSLAFLAPRGHAGSGPNGFPVNRTAAAAAITSGPGRPRLAPAADRGPARDCALPGRAAANVPAHARPADRLRRGLVDDAAVDRGADP